MEKQILKDIIQWDIGTWKKALSFWEDNVDWSNVNSCLELGGREGGLSLWLALKGKRVICSDLRNVKNSASVLHRKYNLENIIEYQDINATDIPYENTFDIIVFKSIIGGIGAGNKIELQQQTFQQIHKALKPGGKLLFAENLISSRFHQYVRKKFVSWGEKWRYVSIPELQDFMSKFSKVTIKTTGVSAAFGRSEFQRNILMKLDRTIFNNLSRQSWKYVGYGIAEK